MIRIIFLLFITINLHSQDPFSIQPIPTYATGTVSDNFFNAETELTNQTDSTITIQWKRILQDIPTGWESAICLNFTCLPSDVDSGEITIDAGYSLDLNQTFFPNEILGTGRVELKVWLKNDTSFILYPEYFGTVETTSIVNSNIKKQYSIFPNPTMNTFSLDENLAFSKVEIVDTQGQLIHSFSRQSTYNIEFLPTNLYFILVLSEQKDVLAVLKLNKL